MLDLAVMLWSSSSMTSWLCAAQPDSGNLVMCSIVRGEAREGAFPRTAEAYSVFGERSPFDTPSRTSGLV